MFRHLSLSVLGDSSRLASRAYSSKPYSRYLNVNYLERLLEINTANMSRVNQVKIAIANCLRCTDARSDHISLCLNDGSRVTRFYDIPKEYFMENGSYLSVQLLNDSSSVIKAEVKSSKSRKLPHPIVLTSVTDTLFVDRQDSFKILADSIEERYGYWEQGDKDSSNHPIAILAYGPGIGKSRFLHELPNAFLTYVAKHYSEKFNHVVSSALFINVTFADDSPYRSEEIPGGIDKSIALRILFQVDPEDCESFSAFYIKKRNQDVFLEDLLKNLVDDSRCIFLGLDEINKVNDTNIEEFKGIFRFIGGISCSFKPFIVPILSGTAIDAMLENLSGSMNSALHIPLPFLSFESCLSMVANADPEFEDVIETDHYFKQLIFDMGGHPWAMELLIDQARREIEYPPYSHWAQVGSVIENKLIQRYQLQHFSLGAAIAYSCLGFPVDGYTTYPDSKDLTFMDLQEKGIVKLEDCRVKLPYIFFECYLYGNVPEFNEFWSDLMIKKDMKWEPWVRNYQSNYFAFRMSLFGHLSIRIVRLRDFFDGALMNLVDADMEIRIPKPHDINIEETRLFPMESRLFDPYCVSVFHSSESFLDTLMYVQKSDGTPLLLAIQCKEWTFSHNTKGICQEKFDESFTEAKSDIEKHHPQMDFVYVLLAHRGSNTITLPPNCVLISESEELAFLGDAIAGRASLAIERHDYELEHCH